MENNGKKCALYTEDYGKWAPVVALFEQDAASTDLLCCY